MNEKDEKVYMRLVKLLSSMVEDRDKTIMELQIKLKDREELITNYEEMTDELMRRLGMHINEE